MERLTLLTLVNTHLAIMNLRGDGVSKCINSCDQIEIYLIYILITLLITHLFECFVQVFKPFAKLGLCEVDAFVASYSYHLYTKAM